MSEVVFPEGIFFSAPREGAPDFVKGSVAIKVEQAIPWLQQNVGDSGYVNLDLKLSKGGKLYLSLNSWQPSERSGTAPPQRASAPSDAPPPNDEIPF